MECEYSHLHASNFSDIIMRRNDDFSVCDIGETRIVQVVSILSESYPGHSLLTEDESVNTFIEIGPGDTVTKFLNRINESIKAKMDALNVENIPTLDTVVKLLKKN